LCGPRAELLCSPGLRADLLRSSPDVLRSGPGLRADLLRSCSDLLRSRSDVLRSSPDLLLGSGLRQLVLQQEEALPRRPVRQPAWSVRPWLLQEELLQAGLRADLLRSSGL